jgi:hypothetical protein
MRRALLMLAALTALAIAAVGCGTTSSTNEPVQPSASTAAEAPADAAGLGDTLAIDATDTKLEVTASQDKRVKAVKLYGSEMSPAAYGVKMTVRNVGDTLYDDSVSNCCVVIDTKDQTHAVNFVMVDKSGKPLTGILESVKIAPGDKRSGWVFFDMKPSAKPRTLQFTADSGFGPQVGEWSLQ